MYADCLEISYPLQQTTIPAIKPGPGQHVIAEPKDYRRSRQNAQRAGQQDQRR